LGSPSLHVRTSLPDSFPASPSSDSEGNHSVLLSILLEYSDDHPDLLADRLPPHTRPPDSTAFGSLTSRERSYLPSGPPL
jgi:hypothetical protein